MMMQYRILPSILNLYHLMEQQEFVGMIIMTKINKMIIMITIIVIMITLIMIILIMMITIMIIVMIV